MTISLITAFRLTSATPLLGKNTSTFPIPIPIHIKCNTIIRKDNMQIHLIILTKEISNYLFSSKRYLTFTSNEFTGPIPKSIGIGKTKTNLIEVLFSDNKLSGCLPMEIGLLENTILFDASKNSLTGPIPFSFSCLAKMQVLNFANNTLYGAVPEGVCKLPDIQQLTLRNNFITQVGPICRSLISKKVLDVSGNCILGLPEQKSEEECTHFFTHVELCPDEKSMKYIPCKENWYLNEDPAAVLRRPARKVTELRTYAALSPVH